MMKAGGSLMTMIVLAASLTPGVTTAADPVRLYAAGSLRAVMTEMGDTFAKREGIPVKGDFGASGLMRQRIEKGEPAEVFASADMGHPKTLAGAGRAAPVVLFARNRLCALARPGVKVTTETLLERMLDPAIKLGTSTPKSDPSGDYTWLAFDHAEKLTPGAFAKLDAKAMKLVGGPDSPPAPKDRSAYGKYLEDGTADIFLTYCTNTVLATREVPGLQTVQLPPALAVSAEYGLTVLKGARPEAERFARFIVSKQGQDILAKHGFAPAAR
jgi:molybdate transport system substrate-binding protein